MAQQLRYKLLEPGRYVCFGQLCFEKTLNKISTDETSARDMALDMNWLNRLFGFFKQGNITIRSFMICPDFKHQDACLHLLRIEYAIADELAEAFILQLANILNSNIEPLIEEREF